MGKSLITSPRGTYANLATFASGGALTSTPEKLLKGDGTELPISFSTDGVFISDLTSTVSLYTNGYLIANGVAVFSGDIVAAYQSITLAGSTIYGAITFTDAVTFSSLSLDGSSISATGAAINMDTATVTGEVSFDNILAQTVESNVVSSGSIDCNQFYPKQIISGTGSASATWEGDLFFGNGSTAGNLSFTNGTFSFSGTADKISLTLTGTPTSTTPLTYAAGDGRFAPISQTKTGAFTAAAGQKYTCIGTYTVTMPGTGTTNQEIEFVIEGASSSVTILGVTFAESDLSVIARYTAGAWALVPRQFNRDVTSYAKILTPSRVGQVPVSGELINMDQALDLLGEWIVVTAATDQTLSNNTTFTDSTQVQLPLSAGLWEVRSFMRIGAGSTYSATGSKATLVTSGGSVTFAAGRISAGAVSAAFPSGNIYSGTVQGATTPIGGSYSQAAASLVETREFIMLVSTATTLKQQFASVATGTGAVATHLTGNFLAARRIKKNI